MDIDDFKDMFISETTEHVQQLNDNMLKLEKKPDDMDALADVFRSSHTIKGMAATMNYEDISTLAHEMESALDRYRKTKSKLDPDTIEVIFECLDVLEKLTDAVQTGEKVQVNLDRLLDRLGDIKDRGPLALLSEGEKTEPAKVAKKEPEKKPVSKKEEPAKPEEKPAVKKPEKIKAPVKTDLEEDEEIRAREQQALTEMQEYMEMFLSEANENITGMNQSMLKLEKAPGDMEAIASFFRASHTMKGMAATMGFKKMADLTHNLETAMDYYRKTKTVLDQDMIDVSFECMDTIERMVEDISDGKIGIIDIRGVMGKLSSIIERNGLIDAGPGKKKAGVTTEKARPPEPKPAEVKEGAPGKPPEKSKETAKEKIEASALKSSSSIRISIENLEALMNLVGELVINKSRLKQISMFYELKDLNEAIGRVDRLTTDLQDEVLKMRMVPTRHIFNRFPRMVRDLAKIEKKQIEFIVVGWDIELDRTVLDEISEPLVHLIRNSIDHGIQTPEMRAKNGKPKKGTLRLVAIREKNHVKIYVEDDGKGIDPEAIRKKAVEKGLVESVKAAELTQQECINMLFLPGFSTAKKVTDVSGRGVGMDVVKTKIESLGGLVEMTSTPGVGTKVTMLLPLTMAIIRALLIKVDKETYAIPISTVFETIKYNRKSLKTVHGKEMLVLRDEVIPVIHLREIFETEGGQKEEMLRIVIVERGEKKLGLVVDDLIGQQEIVIKPLGKLSQNIRGISGATILGDGRVALIIDVATLI
jgi:two-component system chemotaxis sensor kinase CheA